VAWLAPQDRRRFEHGAETEQLPKYHIIRRRTEVQASRTWVPPAGTLGRILEQTRRRLPSLESGRGPEPPHHPSSPPQPLGSALRRSSIAIIAELKRRSPSKGALNEALDPRQSAQFESAGAAAISVLTEPAFFGGSMDDLRIVRESVKLPVLKKDFHIDDSQLHEARSAGASAVLLIARALSPDQLPRLMAVARELELEALVEVRSEAELGRAVEAGAEIIGVNSRDLETLEVDEGVPEHLIPLIPPDVTAVWESGIRNADDVRRAADAGADAVLVGSALSQAKDPAQIVRALINVPRKPRAG
jgi:indole-3-glycerol phosphate synthase